MKAPRTLVIIVVAVLLGGVIWSRWVKTMLDRAAPPSTEYLPPDPVPDFNLTESHGQAISFADLRGKIWVANLMFTSCGSTCPILSTTMSSLDRALGPRDDVRLVSITITPEFDKPEVLRAYAEGYHASARRPRPDLTQAASTAYTTQCPNRFSALGAAC